MERSEIEAIVEEYRHFLEAAIDGDGARQCIILEIR